MQNGVQIFENPNTSESTLRKIITDKIITAKTLMLFYSS